MKIPKQTLLTLAMRAKKLDSVIEEYLLSEDNPIILHLGCGLDSRILRVNFSKGNWFDLDFPEVIELRKIFYKENANYSMIPSSVTDFSWIERIKINGKACIIAEGLFMYLHEDQIKVLFEKLQNRFPSSIICFDAYSRITAKSVNNHPSIKKTGARVYWGIDDPKTISSWGKGITFIEEWYFTQSDDIPLLNFKDRILFKIIGKIKAANTAHRILKYLL